MPSTATLVPVGLDPGLAGAVSRRGSIALFVLLILGVAVMLAGSFVGLMATQRASGVRQTAVQTAAQSALAGALFAQQTLISDFQTAYSANIPQRFPDLYCPNPVTRLTNYNYGGRIPVAAADRRGMDWKFAFEGRLGRSDGDTEMTASGTTVADWPANRFQKTLVAGINPDPTRPAVVDSMDTRILAVPLRYVPFKNGWYTIPQKTINWHADPQGAGYAMWEQGLAAAVYYNGNTATWPRWYTLSYLDDSFKPLPMADRALAAYESRVAVMPVPLDGCLSNNFDPQILGATTGGRFRYGAYSTVAPTGQREITPNDQNTIVSSATSAFRDDWMNFTRGIATGSPVATVSIKYPVNSTYGYTVGDSYMKPLGWAYNEQAFQVDYDWMGGGFPLAQQYGVALGNMLGVMGYSDCSPSVSVRKRSEVTFSGNPALAADRNNGALYGWTGAAPEFVKTTVGSMDLAKGTIRPRIGMLTQMVNTVLNQGYLGNTYNYDTSLATPTDKWWQPSGAMTFQPGMHASWQHYHTKMGFGGSTLQDALNANSRNVDIINFAFTPFGNSLDRSRVPQRNRGGGSLGDIDCPWYVNVMMLNRDVGHAMTAGLTSDWYMSTGSKSRAGSGDSDGTQRVTRPTNKAALLPIPPRKRGLDLGGAWSNTYAAVWDDGMAKTGADGAEGGALPPDGGTAGTILGSTLKPPPKNSTECTSASYYGPNWNAFPVAPGGGMFWRNPLRDELVASTEEPRPRWAANTAYAFGITVQNGGRLYLCIAPPLPAPQTPGISAPSGGPTGTAALITDNTVYWQYTGEISTVIGYSASTATYPGSYYTSTSKTAYCLHGMTGNNAATGLTGEDRVHWFVTGVYRGDPAGEAHAFQNFPNDPDDFCIRDNTDSIDERLSYQNDITAALWKTLVDCLSDRYYGKQLTGLAHGYDKIEDVETVFLAYLGISVQYTAPQSHASTVGMSRAHYRVYPQGGTYPLGQMNQLNAMSAKSPQTEIRTDRTSATAAPNGKMINTAGSYGQRGFRNGGAYATRDATGYLSLGWPVVEYPEGSGTFIEYRPTWSGLSRVLEHRLNDVRMSLFGTPALDLNQDGIIDATTVGGSGVVTGGGTSGETPEAQLNFSITGRWSIGRNQLWRIFIRSELWDRRNDQLATESALEQVVVIDPDNNGVLNDSHILFSRWHANPITGRRLGPTNEGRTEAYTLP